MAHALPVDAVILLTLIFALPLLALLVIASWISCRLAKRWNLIPRDKKLLVERRWMILPAAAFATLFALCFAYGAFIEADWVQTTRTEIKVAEPVLGFDRFRIVHLSDLHLERIGRREHRMIEQIREAKPQLILLTGDYMNVREGAVALREVLGALEAPFGVVGIEGNWDTKFVCADLFRRSRATFLVDDSMVLERDGRRLRLVGQGVEPSRPLKELLPAKDDGVPTIFLHHMPDGLDQLRARAPGQRVDLFLCGHTHGGQVCLPFWGAVITLSKFHKQYESGLYMVDGIPMYVNRGIGSGGGGAPHVRFLARPEVAVIDLVYR
ncbi:MAG TPA: metallophosphoesterase [Planctomycetota bacterium]|nr:metallophosphoesterase [Planctomycetota bacterium]